jgi:predicted permease
MNVTMPDPQKFSDFHAQALDRISALPEIENVAFAWGVPLTGNSWTSRVTIDGENDTGKLKDALIIQTRSVTADYFDLLRLKIVAGRTFRAADAWYGPHVDTNAPFVAVINEALAEKYFTKQNPIGKKLRFVGMNMPAEIVGVIANVHTEALSRNAGPEIYFSLWQRGAYMKHLIVRTRTNLDLARVSVERELRAIDPTVAIEHIKTLENLRKDSISSQAFVMQLLVGFSVAGTILALVGIYGVLSLSVASRRREIATRIALGAQRHHLLQIILTDGFKIVATGSVIGIVIAVVSTRFLQAFLFGIEPNDLITFAIMTGLFVTVAFVACYIPAYRATKVDPMTALRCE